MRAREEAIGCLNECTVGLVGTRWQQYWSHNYGLDCDVDINKADIQLEGALAQASLLLKR